MRACHSARQIGATRPEVTPLRMALLEHSRLLTEPFMPKLIFALQHRPFQLYLLGLACIFAGAWAMGEYGSMVPMALASSAGLMLGTPLLRQLLARAQRRPAAAARNARRRD